MRVDEKNLQIIRKKHLFVEMHELNENDQEWHETKRWNYGLEEDVIKCDDKKKVQWTSAHLPTISVFGMMGFRECLKPELIILDATAEIGEDECAKGECQAFNRCLRSVARTIVNHFVRDGQIEPGNASAALDTLWQHLSLKKHVDHDDILKEAKEKWTRSQSRQNLRAMIDETHDATPTRRGPELPSQKAAMKVPPESATMSRRGLTAGSAKVIKVPSLTRFSSFFLHHKQHSRSSLELPGRRHSHSDDDHTDEEEEDDEVNEMDAVVRSQTDTILRGAKTGVAAEAVRPSKQRSIMSMSEGNPQHVMPPKRRRSVGTLQKLLSRKMMFEARRASSVPTLFHSRKKRFVVSVPLVPPPENEDPLKPDAEEEAVHVLIDDQFDMLSQDAVVIVRLANPVASGLEERTHVDEIDDHGIASGESTPAKGGVQQAYEEEKSQQAENTPSSVASQQKKKKQQKRPQDLLARFIVLVLGPKLDESALTSVSAQLCARRHAEMGQAAAALMQDDAVVRAMYESQSPAALLEAIDLKLSSMRILPRTSRPTKAAVKRRASRMYQQLAELKRIAEAQALARAKEAGLRENPDVVELTNTGGRFVRLEYPDQDAKWGARGRDTFTAGFSIGAFLTFAQKYALPLLSGIVLALILANTRAGGYRRWAGASEHDDDDDHNDDHHDDVGRRLSGGSSHGRETAFDLRIDGHDVTLHFIVNDVLMALFFGLAVKEIAEAFQPGGSLYPPTRKAVNPMLGTIGGVVGPICLYFVLIAIAVSSGVIGAYDYMQLARGWGIPTATDISIAWVTAVVLFGTGHPAINYLLLCAVIDDGIGLVIIAVAYPDPNNPLKPVWLLLVILAMVIAYILRRLECARWAVYVFLAGPIAWFGLLFTAVHPSLALCFVVPFMPIKIDSAVEELNERLTLLDGESQRTQNAVTAKDVNHHHLSPLHDFEDAVKNFVDFFVLFAFGAVNAGVRFEDAGPFSIVIVLSLLLGKTLGMTCGSSLAVCLGFPRPEGMSFRHLTVAGVISSVGLTVSLFIAGEAFAQKDQLEGQAKLGALLSLGPALVLVALANFSPGFKTLIKGGKDPPKKKTKPFESKLFKLNQLVAAPTHLRDDAHDDDDDLENPPALQKKDDDDATAALGGVATGLEGDGIPISPKSPTTHEFKDHFDFAQDYHDDDDEEFLEDAVVSNIENTLREIHRIEAQVEKRAGVRRSSSIMEGFRQAHGTGGTPI